MVFEAYCLIYWAIHLPMPTKIPIHTKPLMRKNKKPASPKRFSQVCHLVAAGAPNFSF